MARMTLHDYYWHHLASPAEREAFAARAGTSRRMLEGDIIRRRGQPPTRVVLHHRIIRLSLASEGCVSETAAMLHFAATARLLARLSMAADGYREETA